MHVVARTIASLLIAVAFGANAVEVWTQDGAVTTASLSGTMDSIKVSIAGLSV